MMLDDETSSSIGISPSHVRTRLQHQSPREWRHLHEARRATYRELVGEHFSGCQSIVFVPFASDDHEHYTSRMQDFRVPEGPGL